MNLGIENKLRSIFLKMVIKFKITNLALWLKSDYLLFLIIDLSLIRLNVNGKVNVLCISKPYFNENIQILSKNSRTLNYSFIPTYFFQAIFSKKVDLGLMSQHVSYHSNESFKINKKAYYSLLKRIFCRIYKKHKFQMVVAANYVYSYLQEFARLNKDLSIPFVVFHKEGMAAPATFTEYVKCYTNNIFLGSDMLVYNNNMKNALLGGKVSGLNSGNIKTVGIPRFDKYYNLKNYQGQTITFFSFYPEDKFRHIIKDSKILEEINTFSIRFHKWVMEFARKSNNKILIKTKRNYHYLDYVKKIQKQFGIYSKNLVITNIGDSFNLIKQSNIVLGYNSSTLIEGLIANRKIISPSFNLHPKKDDNYFEGYEKIINLVSSKSELYNSLQSTFKQDQDKSVINSFLEQFIYKNDGKATKRCEKSFLEILNNRSFVDK